MKEHSKVDRRTELEITWLTAVVFNLCSRAASTDTDTELPTRLLTQLTAKVSVLNTVHVYSLYITVPAGTECPSCRLDKVSCTVRNMHTSLFVVVVVVMRMFFLFLFLLLLLLLLLFLGGGFLFLLCF